MRLLRHDKGKPGLMGSVRAKAMLKSNKTLSRQTLLPCGLFRSRKSLRTIPESRAGFEDAWGDPLQDGSIGA